MPPEDGKLEGKAILGDATEFLPGNWKRVRLNEIVAEQVSGDWGSDEPSDVSAQCHTLRGTDFGRAKLGLISDAPRRFIKRNSIVKRQVQVGDILVELSGGSKDQPTGR